VSINVVVYQLRGTSTQGSEMCKTKFAFQRSF